MNKFKVGDIVMADPRCRKEIDRGILKWLDSGKCRVLAIVDNTTIRTTAPEREYWQLGFYDHYLPKPRNFNQLVTK